MELRKGQECDAQGACEVSPPALVDDHRPLQYEEIVELYAMST